jgi:hypothetical protein
MYINVTIYKCIYYQYIMIDLKRKYQLNVGIRKETLLKKNKSDFLYQQTLYS